MGQYQIDQYQIDQYQIGTPSLHQWWEDEWKDESEDEQKGMIRQ